MLTWVFVVITETCFSPFHKSCCHTLDVTEEGTLTLEISNDGHCIFALKVENGSNLSCKDSALEGTAAGISTCAVDDVDWGVSNVAHPSFLGIENSTDFSSEVAVEGCWGRPAKKSIDATWGVCVGWFPLKGGAADVSDNWNRSANGAWGAPGNWNRSTDEADVSGALEKSKLTDLVGPDGRGIPNALFCRDPEDWTGSEKKSTTPPEL